MNIDAINTVLMLAETGNFSRVADKFNLTQSTISARIKVLEDDLGVSLFERRPSGVFLTAEGKQFYTHALTIRQAWQHLMANIASIAIPFVSKRALMLPVWLLGPIRDSVIFSVRLTLMNHQSLTLSNEEVDPKP